jgi:hypothetical protein
MYVASLDREINTADCHQAAKPARKLGCAEKHGHRVIFPDSAAEAR